MSKQQDINSEKDALLINQDVQSIVQKMVDQGVYLITPRLDVKGLSYPALSAVFPDKSEAEIQVFLDKLKELRHSQVETPGQGHRLSHLRQSLGIFEVQLPALLFLRYW